jgi:circadian clock protein KaiC
MRCYHQCMAKSMLASRAGAPARTGPPSHVVPPKGALKKTPSGLDGLDEITSGGLPHGRPTLVYGGPGCGKTLLGLQFLVAGAEAHGEPGVFLAFEESVEDLKRNVRSLGFDLGDLIERRLLVIEHARIDPVREIGQGDYDLEALFMRLARAIDGLQAKRVVIDSLEVLIHRDSDRGALRDSFHRLFRWLANRGVTSIVTAEEGENRRSRHAFEDYVADCVIHLDHLVREHLSTRTLRVVKYRGSAHGTNEYPFLIEGSGLHLLPGPSSALDHKVTSERVSSGVPPLDLMLGGQGYYRGTTVVISGTPGSGKSSLAASYAASSCRRGERVLAFTYEESPEQIVRNMASIGIDLHHWFDRGALHFVAVRRSMYSVDVHLAMMLKAVRDIEPASVVVDPISNLIRDGSGLEAQAVAVRLLDAFKMRGITTLLTHPTSDVDAGAAGALAISSIVDTWIVLETLRSGSERRRTIYIRKSRGMAHSNDIRPLQLTGQGITIADGPRGAVTV